MSPPPKPRKRAVRLTPEALEALGLALAERWQKDDGDGKLTREAQADLMGVSVATAKNMLSGAGADRASFALAFKRLGIPWSDACYEALDKEEVLPPPAEPPAIPPIEPEPPQAIPSPRGRVVLLGLMMMAVVGVAAVGTGLYVRSQAAPAVQEDWTIVFDRHMKEGGALHQRGHYDAAQTQIQQALSLAQRYDSLNRMAAANHTLGEIVGARGRLREAKAYYLKGRDLRNGGDPDSPKPVIDEALGDVETRLGEYESARAHLKLSLEGFRSLHDPIGVASVQRDLGSVSLGTHDLDAADRWFRQSLEGIRGRAEPGIEADVRGRQALVLLARDDARAARALLQGCLAYWTAEGHPRWIALCEMHLGLADERLGDLQSAKTRIARSRDAFARVGDEARLAEARSHLERLAGSGPR